MTTYGGRSANYIPGKEVVNKEPAISKYVVEKLYKVHRERVLTVEKTLDTHLEIPDFLLNRQWKKNADAHKQKAITKNNQDIYNRLTKLENAESLLAKDNKEHVQRINSKLGYLKKLKQHGRLLNMIRIQKENEYLLRRLEKTKPQYTLKNCKEWYKHHELFKAGRRSDPTAGHIMPNIGHLRPKSLPAMSTTISSTFDDAETLTTMLDSKKKRGSGMLPSLDGGRSIASSSLISLSSTTVDGQKSSGSLTGSRLHPLRRESIPTATTAGNGYSSGGGMIRSHHPHGRRPSQDSIRRSDHSINTVVEEENEELSPLRHTPVDSFPSHSAHGEHKSSAATSNHHVTFDAPPPVNVMPRAEEEVDSGDNSDDNDDNKSIASVDSTENHHHVHGHHHLHSSPHSTAANHIVNKGFEASVEDMLLLSSRPFALPAESKNCLVQVYASKEYNENLRLVIVTPTMPMVLLAERMIGIDRAYETVNSGGHSSQLVHSTDNEDLASLSQLLINMFKEADEDGSGSLTFDEFQALMEQVELGISPQELRFVISEADENENGVVDYEEFVPLAVDLIQSFRARNRAKTLSSQQDMLVDDQILQTISASELANAAKTCLECLTEYDKKNYGLIRVADLKRCLNSIANNIGLRENEINLLTQLLPRDQFGRLKYNAGPNFFLEYLSKVRFLTMKNAIIESQGSGLQKYLLELCKEEEKRIEDEQLKHSRDHHGNKMIPPGNIPCRSLINILSNSPRLSLSRLQVLVIMSEASVLDGYINYYQFIPVVTKAIEIMFEPKALRQRAELIERTDLSPEALLNGLSSEQFETRLLTLFRSYDIDHNGTLDQNEFIACLESLELHLTKGEMVALMAAADTSQHGFLQFEDFVKFFTHNLLHLEREKRIRMLQTSISKDETDENKNASFVDVEKSRLFDISSTEKTEKKEEDISSNLLSIFRLSDPQNTGFITYQDFEDILRNFSLHSSKFLMDVMLSELQINPENNLVEYYKSLQTCADLLKVFKAKELAVKDHKEKESHAEFTANKIAQASVGDINHIVRIFRHKIKSILERHNNDPMMRYIEIQQVIRSPQAGLTHSEGNIVLSKLFGTAMNISSPDSSFYNNKSHKNGGSSHKSHGKNEGHKSTAVTAASQHQAGEELHVSPAVMAAALNHHVVPAGMQRSISTDLLAHHDDEENDTNNNTASNTANHAASNNANSTTIKNMKFNFSTQELFEAVYEARKTSFMRNLLQQVDNSTLQKKVLKMLEAALEASKHANEVSLDSMYLPVQRCFDALEGALELHLNRSQIMFIISWAECYDREGTALEVTRFAEHAAIIIAKLNGSEMITTRAQVLAKSAIDEKKALNGLREKDIARQLEMAFTRIAGSLGMPKASSASDSDSDTEVNKTEEYNVHVHAAPGNIVPGDQIIVALQSIPKIRLSEREVATIMAACSISTEAPSIDWKSALPSLVDAIVTLCRERMINRRVSLFVTANSNEAMLGSSPASIATKSSQEESLRQLKQLAEKLLNFVKIAMSGNGEELILQLPSDKMQRKASQLLIEEAYNTVHQEIVQLFRGARFMKTETQSLVALPPSKALLPRRQSAGRDVLLNPTVNAAAVANNANGISSSLASNSMSSPSMAAIASAAGFSINVAGSNSGRPTSGRPPSTQVLVAEKGVSPAVGGGTTPTHAATPSHHLQQQAQAQAVAAQQQQAARLVESATGRMAVMLQVMAVEDHRLFSGSAQLVAQVLSLDASLLLSEALPLRLPSIGAVDREAAEQFVANIVEQIYLVKEPGAEKWAIRIIDEDS